MSTALHLRVSPRVANMAFDWDDDDDRTCFKNVSLGGLVTAILVVGASLLGTSLKRLESTGACFKNRPFSRAPPQRGILTLAYPDFP